MQLILLSSVEITELNFRGYECALADAEHNKQQVWERNAAISVGVKGTAKTAMPSITSITVDIFETEITEFYVLMQSTQIFNE